MPGEFTSIVAGTIGLDIAAVVAVSLTVARGAAVAGSVELSATARLATLALTAQLAHFAEEATTGFYQRFPQLLGQAPWSLGFFVAFNLLWIAIWGISIRGLIRRHHLALFALWFLAIGSMANGTGLAHPLLSLTVSSFFPGLVTSPLVGLLGVLLFRRLLSITKVASVPIDT